MRRDLKRELRKESFFTREEWERRAAGGREELMEDGERAMTHEEMMAQPDPANWQGMTELRKHQPSTILDERALLIEILKTLRNIERLLLEEAIEKEKRG